MMLLLLALAAGQLTPVEQVADALAAGEAAQGRGRHDAMLAAADRLERLGARGEVAADWRARALAAGAKSRGSPWRGRATGPAYRRGELPGGGRLATEQVFMAGETALVAVVPVGAQPLHVSITGPDGAAVCEQRVTPPRAACRWLPVFTKRFRISIANPGPTPARYYLVSN
jgi:hypothetical protein